MAATPVGADEERRLLAAARDGDEAAFERLLDPFRGELQAHRYRMLGGVHDAEDALQARPPARRPHPARGAGLLRRRGGGDARDHGALRQQRPAAGRAAIDERVGGRSQTATLRDLGDDRRREIVDAYTEPMAAGDVPRVVSMLTEEATWSMPPLGTWYSGARTVEAFLRGGPLNGSWRWRHRPAHANGQLAVGTYTYLEGEDAFLPCSLDVLTLAGEKITAVDAFIVRDRDVPPGFDGYSRFPDFPPDPGLVKSVFTRCGLPDRLGTD